VHKTGILDRLTLDIEKGDSLLLYGTNVSYDDKDRMRLSFIIAYAISISPIAWNLTCVIFGLSANGSWQKWWKIV